MATLDEIRAHDANLSIPLYVRLAMAVRMATARGNASGGVSMSYVLRRH
jgi:hypothetical protein